MKRSTALLSVIFLLSITSCSFHSGTTSSGSAMITNENFNIDFAYGSAKTTKVLGIGSFNRDALVLDAKKDLYKNYPLKKGQALGHMTVDFKTTYVLIVSTTIVTISAEVIDFSQENKTEENIQDFIKLTDEERNFRPSKTSDYSIGQEVRFVNDGDTISSTIISAENGLLLLKSKSGETLKIDPDIILK